jgi:hypothetical protein
MNTRIHPRIPVKTLDRSLDPFKGFLRSLVVARHQHRYLVVLAKPGWREIWTTDDTLPFAPALLKEVDLGVEHAIRVQHESDFGVCAERLDEIRVGLIEMCADNHPLNLLDVFHQEIERLKPYRCPGDSDLARETLFNQPD